MKQERVRQAIIENNLKLKPGVQKISVPPEFHFDKNEVDKKSKEFEEEFDQAQQKKLI